MGKRYTEINKKQKEFIQQQKIFFVSTALRDGKINISPKGMDTLRVLGKNRVAWLNLAGSGNETATHLKEHDRITIMFCAFEGNPVILRLYGNAKAFHPEDSEWNEFISLFPPIDGARQIIDVNIDLVQTTCGNGVPYFDFTGERWGEKKAQNKLKKVVKKILQSCKPDPINS